MKKHQVLAFITAGLLFGGCTDRTADNQDGVGDRQQAGAGWNGAGWNGLGWNGLGWNGLGWNGLGWNGLGWNGLGWNGLGWNGLGWNGAGWNGISPDWDLSYFVNNTDLTHDGFLMPDDRDAAFKGMSYWVGCACPSGSSPTWYGWNPFTSSYETHTFSGNFGLAPTWCMGLGSVPQSEQEAVSACLFASINVLGHHVSISMRGYENSLKLADNEKLFMSYASEQYWGNLWEDPSEIFDSTDGNYYPKSKAYACYFPWGNGNAQLAQDLQMISGRTCGWDGCGGPVKTSLACLQPGSVDGSTSAGHDPSSNPVVTPDPAVGWAGANNGPANQYQDIVTGTERVDWRGNQWRRLSVFLGAWADLEVENWKPASYQCSDSCGVTDGCGCYKGYCQGGESGGGQALLCEAPSDCNNCATIVRQPVTPSCGTSAYCTTSTDCVRGRKLTSLNVGCWLEVEFLRPYDLLTNSWVSGTANVHKSGTLAFRYSNGTPGDTSILIRDNIRSATIPGTGFASTGSWDSYDLKTIYPIYPGRSSFSGAVPGVDIAISADPASPAFPHLDYAQMWIGPPYDYQPREMYWDTTKQAIKAGSTVCSTIAVDNTTDFTRAGNVRFRPHISGVDISQLKIVLTHNGKSINYQPDKLDPPWSAFATTFQDDSPIQGTWQACVQSAKVSGTLEGTDIEFEKN